MGLKHGSSGLNSGYLIRFQSTPGIRFAFIWTFCVKGLSDHGLKNIGMCFLPLCWFEPGVHLCCSAEARWAFIYLAVPPSKFIMTASPPHKAVGTEVTGLELWLSHLLLVSKTNGQWKLLWLLKQAYLWFVFISQILHSPRLSGPVLHSLGGILFHRREKPMPREQWVSSWNLIWEPEFYVQS